MQPFSLARSPLLLITASLALLDLLIGEGGALPNGFSTEGHRRVPAVYLSWATKLFLAFFSFNRIKNLRVFNVAFSSISTFADQLAGEPVNEVG